MLQGFHYVWSRPDLRATLIMLFLIGTFGLNFPIFISTMAVGVFHTDARGFGLLSSMMAIGTMSGALLAASRERPSFTSLLAGAAIFGLGCTLAALAPNYWLFAAALVVIGVASLTVTQHLERADATLHRARDARPRDGAAARRRPGRHAGRRADRRMGGGSSRAALGAGRGCGRGVCGGGCCDWGALPVGP